MALKTQASGAEYKYLKSLYITHLMELKLKCQNILINALFFENEFSCITEKM